MKHPSLLRLQLLLFFGAATWLWLVAVVIAPGHLSRWLEKHGSKASSGLSPRWARIVAAIELPVVTVLVWSVWLELAGRRGRVSSR